MLTYLILNLIIFFSTFIFSFEKRVNYIGKLKFLFPAFLITAIFMLAWDSLFINLGIWGFNEKYIIGIYILNIPIEEVLFFFSVPYSCLFIYECINYYFKDKLDNKNNSLILIPLILLCLIISLTNFDKTYTFIKLSLLAILLLINLIKRPKYLNRFLLAFIISIIPFLIFNGILTNGLRFIDSGPIVWYDNNYNLGIRIFTIPIEDLFYSMLMLLMATNIYEKLKRR